MDFLVGMGVGAVLGMAATFIAIFIDWKLRR